ncbi:MAG: HU family DNA-binding protein [Alphaproteobacteria bacterium]|jgi:DNA-binding protein HU-beta|nr:HU family DNA-binding protein [Alphaproteobacteria bacterium]
MNKTDLIEFVAKNAKITKADSEKAVNAVFKGITHTLSKGGEARFVGFGTFAVSKRKARTGRNPRTGAEIKIAASSVARFRPGKELKDSIN